MLNVVTTKLSSWNLVQSKCGSQNWWEFNWSNKIPLHLKFIESRLKRNLKQHSEMEILFTKNFILAIYPKFFWAHGDVQSKVKWKFTTFKWQGIWGLGLIVMQSGLKAGALKRLRLQVVERGRAPIPSTPPPPPQNPPSLTPKNDKDIHILHVRNNQPHNSKINK